MKLKIYDPYFNRKAITVNISLLRRMKLRLSGRVSQYFDDDGVAYYIVRCPICELHYLSILHGRMPDTPDECPSCSNIRSCENGT
jgi:hypothetical protein